MAKKPQTAQTPDVKVEKFKQSLRVQLTREQVAERADRAAQVLQSRDEKEDEMKAAQKHAKSIIEQLEAELRTLSHEVRTRSIYTPVPCTRTHDYAEGIVYTVREDTSEIIDTRRMTEEEAQRELPFEDNGEEEHDD